MKKIKTKEELQIEINQLESKISELERSKLQSSTWLEKSPLLENQYYREKTQEIGKIGTWELDLLTNELIWTDQNYRNFGIPLGTSLTYEMFLNYVHPEDRKYVNTQWTKALTGKPYDIEHRVVINGNVRWLMEKADIVFDANGKPISAIGFTQDITDRKLAEKELKESEEKFKSLIQQSPFVVELYDLNGLQKSVNKAYEELWDFPAETTVNKFNVLESKEVEDSGLIAYVKRAYAGESVVVPEFIFDPKGDTEAKGVGRVRWLSTRIYPLKELSGKVKNIVIIHQDITDRKLAEKELKESEERFRNAITYSPYPLMIHADGEVLQLSEEWIKQTGYTISDIPTIKGWSSKAYGNDAIPSQEFIDSLYKIDKPQYDGDWDVRIKDGTYRLWDFRTSPIGKLPNGKSMVISMASDITERKLTEQALSKSEERFELAMTATKDGLFDWNLVTNEIYFSPGWKNILGYKNEELANDVSVWEKLTRPEDVEKSWKIQQEVINKERDRFEIEFKMKHKDGHWVDVLARAEIFFDENDKAIRMVGTHVDITERKLAEDKIRAAEENLQNTFDISPSIIAKANLNTGYFLEANKAVTRTLGYSLEEFVSKSMMEFIHPDDRQRTIDEISDQLEGKDTTFFENRYLCKDGSYKWMAWNATKANEKGIVTAIASDISVRKTTEIELKIALDKALESDRLKSAFLANMSHEIRTPMNGIRGFIGLLKEPNLSRSEINTYSNIIDKSSDRLLNTINDIIDIAKIEAGEMLVSKNETSINSMMDELYSFYSPEAKLKGLSLLLKPFTQQLTIITDSHKLYGIMSNLIKNAIKYTDKGSITFGYVLRKNTESDLNEQDRSVKVEFFVEDTGTGVPKKRLQAIFNRFEQADIEDKKALEGSGLGLAISKAYIDMLGGEIFVESEPGKGSKFTFTIPHNEIKKESEMKITKTIDNKTSKLENLNVLVVEDDEVSTVFFKTMLEGVFQNVIFAKNGMEAIQLCKNGSEVDLVLMDIKMPVMDGYNATREIRKFNKDLVIIAQTAYALHGDKEKAIEAGCNDYITKPIIKTQLLELISKHVGKCSI